MITASDLVQMQADLRAIRDDNPIAIQLRRGNVTLEPQIVRITRGRPGRWVAGRASGEARADALIVGEANLDIAIGDRFTVAGAVYEVTFVRPDTRAGIIAEATLAK